MRSVTATILAAAMIAAGAGEAAFAAAGCRAIDGKPRFEIVGEVARDRASGLEWKRCSVGATWSGTACEGEAASLTLDEAEAAAKAAGDDWRLPDVKELYELIDDDCGKPPPTSARSRTCARAISKARGRGPRRRSGWRSCGSTSISARASPTATAATSAYRRGWCVPIGE